eukprot:TRINITY_DN76821_c0_g1_i1.p1 TRINITY_DN76821_c0_g1~~TRINITY_DN76821_c0_g1_i1.p1  ORF type:complete len:370 (-),score=74.94 TRINITY_DN76821_c0_g1_i1:79-1188(-)
MQPPPGSEGLRRRHREVADGEAAAVGRHCAEGSLFSSPVLVPLVLFLASVTTFFFPERGIAVVLLLAALSAYGPASEPVVSCFALAMEKIVLRAVCSRTLIEVLRGEMSAVICDPRVQQSFLDSSTIALQASMTSDASQEAMVTCCVKAVRDGKLKSTIKESIMESMHDAELRTATVDNIKKAAIDASQDHSLQSALNTAGRNAVKEALSDESLIRTLFHVLQEGLRDPGIHSAALKGALSTINPLKGNPINTLKGGVARLPSVSSNSKAARVEEEAEALASVSGLSRDPPPSVAPSPASSSLPLMKPAPKTSVPDLMASTQQEDAQRPRRYSEELPREDEFPARRGFTVSNCNVRNAFGHDVTSIPRS